MKEKFKEIKDLVKKINENVGFLTLTATLVTSLSLFIGDILFTRYEKGYSSFFGLDSILQLNYDFIDIFFTCIIAFLFVSIFYLALGNKYKVELGMPENGIDKLSTYIMLTVIVFSVIYLYILTKLILNSYEILILIYIPFVVLTVIIIVVMVGLKKSCYTLIATVSLVFMLLVYFKIVLFYQFTLYLNELALIILSFPVYLSFIDWLVNRKLKLKKENDKSKREEQSKKDWFKYTFLYLVIIISLFAMPIAYILSIPTSLGWEHASQTKRIYTTIHNGDEYILFSQSNYYIALPIEEKYKCESNLCIKTVENEFIYLNKENVSVRSDSVIEIKRHNVENSIIIALDENKVKY